MAIQVATHGRRARGWEEGGGGWGAQAPPCSAEREEPQKRPNKGPPHLDGHSAIVPAAARCRLPLQSGRNTRRGRSLLRDEAAGTDQPATRLPGVTQTPGFQEMCPGERSGSLIQQRHYDSKQENGR